MINKLITLTAILGCLVASAPPSLPKISQVHITLGDYFANKESKIIYRVGYAIDTPDISITLKVTSDSSTVESVFSTKLCREYKKIDNSDPKNPINYTKNFCFVELVNLPSPKQFKYQFFLGQTAVREAFYFNSNIYDSETPKIVAFGDHDVITVGQKTKDALEKFDYDMIVFCGDLAYDIQFENGKRGDDYFVAMERVLTKAPFIISPGNHENYDDGKMIANRFWMPGAQTIEDNHLFAFQVHDILFATLNFDMPLNIQDNLYWDWIHRLDKLVEVATARFKPKFKVFFSHRPFYCTQFNDWAYGCPQLPWVMKPFEDVVRKHDFNLMLFGHVHAYERFTYLHDWEISKDNSKAIIVTGAAGNHEIFDDMVPFEIEFKRKNIYKTLGFSLLRVNAEKVTVDWVAVEGLKVMDTITLPYPGSNSGANSTKWILLFSVLLLIVVVLAVVVGKKIYRDRKASKAPVRAALYSEV